MIVPPFGTYLREGNPTKFPFRGDVPPKGTMWSQLNRMTLFEHLQKG